jgi:predicted ATPase/class 3 adenylate cyclase
MRSANLTLLFSDVEGSTRLWESEPEAMAVALRRHDEILRAAIEGRGGHVFKTVGDGFYATFEEASSAVRAAVDAQQTLNTEGWPTSRTIRVRMAIHSGMPEARDNDYFGPVLNRLARLLSAGHGGQVLLSQAAVSELRGALPDDCRLLDLGIHSLSDLERAEQVSMLLHPDLPSEFPALRTLDSFPNNLPRHLSSFVGRREELDQLSRLLDEEILITVSGSGGTGKSRLVLQSAAENLERYPDGVWFVELASIFDGDLIPQTVASTLGIREGSGVPVDKALADHLKNKAALLLLDNCEHLVEACAGFVETVLQAAPKLQVVATSREPLGIRGEAVFRIPSLPVPSPSQIRTTKDALASDAVRLLVERAKSIQPQFELTDSSAKFAVEVCQRLDGIPFAIELAASRLKVLSLKQIAERLNDRFTLLTGGSRTALPRQQTLRAMIDWSHDLLSQADKTVIRRLAVFVGGCTLEAAEEICHDDSFDRLEVLESLTHLVDKSLVVHIDAADPPRYRMLETVVQYAGEKLAESGEDYMMLERHAAFFSRFCGEVEEKLTGPDQLHWLDVIESEHDNIRAVLAFCRDHAEHVDLGLSLVGAIGRFWTVRGYLSEGRAWIDGLLSAAGPEQSENLATACRTAGQLAYWQGDSKAGREYGEMSLSACRAIGDRRGETISLFRIGFAALAEGDLVAARTYFEQARELGIEIGDHAGLPHLTNALGELCLAERNIAEAKTSFLQALQLFESQGDRRSIAGVKKSLAMVALEQDQLDESLVHLREGLAIRRELNNETGIAVTLDCIGIVFARRGHFGKAILLLAAAHGLHASHGSRPEPSDAPRIDEVKQSADAALGFEQFDLLWQKGLALPLEDALELATTEADIQDDVAAVL